MPSPVAGKNSNALPVVFSPVEALFYFVFSRVSIHKIKKRGYG